MPYYYEVLVATPRKLNIPLIYSSSASLASNQIVQVSLQGKPCLGLIYRPLAPQELKIKNRILSIRQVTDFKLPETLVKALLAYGQTSSLHLSGLAQLLLSNAPLKARELQPPTQLTSQPTTLTTAQRRAYQGLISDPVGQPQLLLGVNASGKTRIYAELIKASLKRGQSALILVPEIGLSAQTLELLQAHIDQPILHFHSQLTPRLKNLIWQVCHDRQVPQVLLGPRSASCLPLAQLGLIILDEFHDDSFKQDRQPIYDCLPLASQLAKSHQAHLVCGSATPKVEDYYHFQRAGYPIYQLQQRALPSQQPQLRVLPQVSGRNFHPQALEAIKTSLRADHQVLVFHNRRGHWRLIKCPQCYEFIHCPECQRPLVFHQDQFRLRCHVCSLSQAPLSLCPGCQSALIYSQAGSKALLEELRQFLIRENLEAQLHRFDSDNLTQESLVKKITQIQQQPRTLILGTRIIGQGLDLPRLQTVVIVDAQQSLLSSDYRTQEKQYQLLHQLSGRVGRGHLAETKVIIQTAQPQDPILLYALQQDWLSFYQAELANRQRYRMPPFSYLSQLSVRRSSLAKTRLAVTDLYQQLRRQYPRLEFYTPNRVHKLPRQSVWQGIIHVRSFQRRDLIKLAQFCKDSPDTLNLEPRQLFTRP